MNVSFNLLPGAISEEIREQTSQSPLHSMSITTSFYQDLKMAPMNTNAIPQALLKRNTSTTKDQFSAHWFEKHAAIVLPYFHANGVDYYAQIHNPILRTNNSSEELDISDWDGAAELRFKDVRPEGPEGGNKYFQEMILADERRFLVSEALEHYKMVDGGTVTGDRKVIIEDGKVVYELGYLENVKIWQMYVNGQTG